MLAFTTFATLTTAEHTPCPLLMSTTTTKKFPEVKNPDYSALANDVLSWWKANDIFKKSIQIREGAPSFTFYEGPPSANGTPGIHHVMARAVKDIFCRYNAQKGKQVHRKAGWDTHGLPVELQVEKLLGITKEDIGKKISVADYNKKCRETVMRYTDEWNTLTERMGYWVDLDNPYITYETDYVESLWNLLKRLYDKGLLYKGYTIQPYSPAAGTGLSSHELNQPGTYKDVKDTTIVAMFRAKEAADHTANAALYHEAGEQVYFLAWTTTPWTLPANSALAVGKNITYVKVKTLNPYLHTPVSVILAKDLVPKFFTDKGKDQDLGSYKAGDKVIPWQEVASYTGAELEGFTYHQLMPYVQPESPAFRVIIGDFVSTEDGTGIVHIAPTFGADDFRVAQQAGIPAIMVKDELGQDSPIVDRTGRFVQEITDFPGFYVKNYQGLDESAPDYKSTDVLIAIKLKEEGKAFRVEKYEHTYPHCWRTDKPILYYPLRSWFIKTTAMKDRLVELNTTINWKPESTGTGRFGNWLENLVDWNLSRSRYWGTPLPIWRTEDGAEEICIGSMKQLEQELEMAIQSGLLSEQQMALNTHHLSELKAGNLDLHRPAVDEVFLVKNGQVLIRETDLVDVWFDSGAMPYAQWHYPFENEELFARNYPADFIAEGVDQTRGWFYTLHALAVLLFDSVAFKNVIANGLVLDKDGNKMSKRLGNAVDPFATMDKVGPDPLRWYMIANAPPWENLKFNPLAMEETQRKFFGTLHNTYSFFALYANLDGFAYQEEEVSLDLRPESDRWVLSKLNSLITIVDEAYAQYEPTRAARAIQDYVNDDLSNWYVRLNRKRFWKGDYSTDKVAAYQTLYTCLVTISKLMAPIAPFYAERLWQDLNQVTGLEQAESIHLTDFPVANAALVNDVLEQQMALIQRIASMGHAIRKEANLRVRQPLHHVAVGLAPNSAEADLLFGVHAQGLTANQEDILKQELNVKQVITSLGTPEGVSYNVLPKLPELGKKLGKALPATKTALQQLTPNQLQTLVDGNTLELNLPDGSTVSLTRDDVLLTVVMQEGFVGKAQDGLAISLDTHLTDALKQEGLAREVVNRVQNARKDMGLEVQDKINILADAGGNDLLATALKAFGQYIMDETQALSLELVAAPAGAVSYDLDAETVLNMSIVKA